MQYTGKVCIITGGASGIGRALAIELGSRGAVLVITDINAEGAAQVAAGIPGATSAALDVTNAEAVASLVQDTRAQHGRLDIMFNNAGIAVSGDARDLSLTHWRRVIDVNLMGVVYGSDAAYKVMAAQGFGHIVNIASLAGLIPFPTSAPYCTTKHAVVGLSQSLRIEGEDLGVRVSAVCPGFVESNIYEASEALNVRREKLLENIPFAKVPTAAAARAILAGMEANRAIIIFPIYARILWWLQKLLPIAVAPLGRRMIRDYRKLRTPPGAS